MNNQENITEIELENIINKNINQANNINEITKINFYKKIFNDIGFKLKKELELEIKEENSNNIEWKVYFKLTKDKISYLIKIRGTALTHYYNGKLIEKYGYRVSYLEVFKL